MEGELVCPGQRLGLEGDVKSGKGTVVNGKYVCAALVGEVRLTTPEDTDTTVVEVVRGGEEAQPRVPKPGDQVTCRVNKLTSRMATVSILCIGEDAVDDNFDGIIRVADVRETEVDKVEILNSYRPGDIVRATVISLGDNRSYYLSTAKVDLGVLYAKSTAGSTMVPINWKEMQCPVTLAKEPRKVAKVDS